MKTNHKKIRVRSVFLDPEVQLFLVVPLSAAVFFVASHYDLMDRFVEFAEQHEQWNVDDIFIVGAFLCIVFAVFSLLLWRDALASKRELKRRNQELETTLREMQHLRGILPVCTSCKKIPDDAGYWHQVELYIQNHSNAETRHGLCPSCLAKLRPILTPDDVAG